ncbi:hypothetical protein [Rhizobium ruizarguesonis]|nr:hypothetical protein [Rhizobium ruizarguesonis]
MNLSQVRKARGDDTRRQQQAIDEFRAKWFDDGVIEKGTVRAAGSQERSP